MSAVHCRFHLSETARVKRYDYQGPTRQVVNTEATRVRLTPVQGDPFGYATPGGSMEMVINTPSAQEFFTSAPLGQEFDIVITPVVKAHE